MEYSLLLDSCASRSPNLQVVQTTVTSDTLQIVVYLTAGLISAPRSEPYPVVGKATLCIATKKPCKDVVHFF